ncbi:hypothetical protein AB1207_14420 [Kineococcus endophyticus]|uniref:Secreted protein with PEP-CTERM sorting signal n=1 Tax=Kineococcus endophyticus TaxID=1181883 RepID=A0ABV3P9U0_9ACTN
MDDRHHLRAQQRSTLRAGSWVLLVVGLVVNVAGSLGFAPLAVGVAGGVAVAVAVAGLVRFRRRTR